MILSFFSRGATANRLIIIVDINTKKIIQFIMIVRELSNRIYLLDWSHNNDHTQVEVKTCARKIHCSSLHWFQSSTNNSQTKISDKPGASPSLHQLLGIHHPSRGDMKFHTNTLVHTRWTTEFLQLPWTCTSCWSRGRHHRSLCWLCSLQSDHHLWGSYKSGTHTKL